MPAGSSATGEHPRETVKETLISIIIAFVMAFVFRGFVVEAFVIPTGSMAPTLLGQHMRFQGGESGWNWAVGPWHYRNERGVLRQEPLEVQGQAPNGPVVVHDPMSGAAEERRSVPLRAGDRILVLKYLYALREPTRYDVIVFKNPAEPSVNYIKRLIGVGDEQLALVDGDVFTRPVPAGAGVGAGWADWSAGDWRLARKPDDAARAVWQPVFDSAYTPMNQANEGARWFRSPWAGQGWQVADRRSYSYEGASATSLRWRSDAEWVRGPVSVAEAWEITDRYAYDEINPQGLAVPRRFPVGDVRLRAGVEIPAGAAVPSVAAVVTARGHEFRGLIDGSRAVVQMRRLQEGGEGGGSGGAGAWTTLGEAAVEPLKAGAITDVELWHIDQSVRLFVGGRAVVRGEYDWTPAQRLEFATGRPLGDLLRKDRPEGQQLSDPGLYRKVGVAWEFGGGPVTLHRVGLDRDLYYRPDFRRNDAGYPPAWATHPSVTMTLGRDQLFACGDNSPASEDSRLWDRPDPWVSVIDPTPGVVPRELLLGKAFFVYFPALAGSSPIPMPDFGRLRFIR
jgi:signal peptidase I